MTIVGILLVLLVIGFVAWLVGQLPLQPNIQRIIIGVMIFLAVLYILQGFGVIGTALRVH